MDYFIGFIIGYCCKEIYNLIKYISTSYFLRWGLGYDVQGWPSIMTTSNGFTQKELNQMIFDKLDDIDKKLDEKLDKSEFYKVLGLVATVILIVGSLSM